MPVFRHRNTSSYSNPPVTASTADSTMVSTGFSKMSLRRLM